MSHMVEQMAYVGETPWHKLGTVLAPGCTIAEMITAAGLDWTVELQQLQLPNGTAVDRFAAVRSSDGSVLGTVGKAFRTVQNKDAFAWFAPFLDSGLAQLETAGALFDGQRVWVLAKLNQADDVIVAKADDRVARYILLAHGHDGTMAVRGGYTATRVVCNNTLSAAVDKDADTVLNIRHTQAAGAAMAAMQDAIMAAGKTFDRAADVFRALAGRNFTAGQLTAYLRAVFPATVRKAEIIAEARARHVAAEVEAEGRSSFAALMGKPYVSQATEIERATEMAQRITSRAHDSVLEILEAGGRNGDLKLQGVAGTAWAALNSVTEYLTHQHGRTPDARFNTVMFGNVGDRAIQTAQDIFLG